MNDTTTATAVTEEQATAVLNAVAAWIGQRGYGTPLHADGSACRLLASCPQAVGGLCRIKKFGPAPTGWLAAARGLGPVLRMGWDWPDEPTPAVILEGGPHDWAVECCSDVQAALKAAGVDVFVEPYASYALCIYPGGF